jgi:hypothetical protein
MDSFKFFHTNTNTKSEEKQEPSLASMFNFNTKPNPNLFTSNNPFDINFPSSNNTQSRTTAFDFKPIPQTQDNFGEGFQEPFQERNPFFSTSYKLPPGMQGQFFPMPNSMEKKHDEFRRTAQAPIDADFERKIMEKVKQTNDFFGDSINFGTQNLNRLEIPQKPTTNYNSISPMVQPVSRPLGQIKQPFSPQIMPRMLPGRMKEKKEKRGSIPATKVEEIMGTIETCKINPISLLNEISTKIKKKVDYSMTESPFGKIRVFECICRLDKETVGTGKGNSKQAAKTEAAQEGVRTLLSKEAYMPERAAIILSVQKSNLDEFSLIYQASGQIISVPQFGNISPVDSPQLSSCSQDYVITKPYREGSGDFTKSGLVASSPNNMSHISNDSDSHMNDSPLYELNVIAKECFIEPIWVVSNLPNLGEGEFEAELKFEKLVAFGKGRKKQDAKREAAAAIIYQIRSNPQLKEKFNPKISKPNPSFGEHIGKIPSRILPSEGKEKKRRLFESAIEVKIFEDLHKKDSFSKDNLKKMNFDFEDHLNNLSEKYATQFLAREHSQEVYKKISDYTSISIANPRQVMFEAEKHLADLVTECVLVPVGSFGLECVRSDKQVIDAIITFREKSKTMTDMEFLELYKASFEDCQKLDKANGLLALEFGLKIVSKKDKGVEELYFEILEKSVRMKVYVSNISKMEREKSPLLYMNKFDYSIVHLKRIYQCFEDSPEDLNDFRTLLTAMRIWRERNGLEFLRAEIIDIIILNDFINNRGINIPGSAINCLMILDYEEITRAVLIKFDSFYETLYNKLTEDQKAKIFSSAGKSLYTLFRQNFDEAKFN